MYENSGSQFFRITTGIKSGTDPSDESKFIMTFNHIGIYKYAATD